MAANSTHVHSRPKDTSQDTEPGTKLNNGHFNDTEHIDFDFNQTQDDQDHEKDDDEDDTVPDGGYGWAVVFGCFLSHVITGGFERGDGVIYLQFLDRSYRSFA